MSSCHSSTFWSGSSPRSNLVKGWQASASLARIPWHKSAMIGGLVWWMWQNLKHTASHCIILSVTFCRFVHDSRAALEFETLCRSPKIKLLGDAFLSFSLSPHLERSYIGRKSSLYHPLPFKPATLILPHHCKRSLRQSVKDIWNKMQPTNPNAHTYAVTHNTFLQ